MKAYRFKITLKGSHPPVWRRIIVPATAGFDEFSKMIQDLFGFEGYHLAEFRFPGLNRTMWEMQNEDSWDSHLIMGRHCLEEFEEYTKFTYTYDFGDDWEFSIQQEEIMEYYAFNYPTLLKHKGDNLIEDVGGVWGYQEIRRAWADPKADIEEFLMEMAGEEDLHRFEPESAQSMLEFYMFPDTFTPDETADEEDDDDEEEPDGWRDDVFSQLERMLAGYDPEDGPDEYPDAEEDVDDDITVLNAVQEILERKRLPENFNELAGVIALVQLQALTEAAVRVSDAYGIPIEDLIVKIAESNEEMEAIKWFHDESKNQEMS